MNLYFELAADPVTALPSFPSVSTNKSKNSTEAQVKCKLLVSIKKIFKQLWILEIVHTHIRPETIGNLPDSKIRDPIWIMPKRHCLGVILLYAFLVYERCGCHIVKSVWYFFYLNSFFSFLCLCCGCLFCLFGLFFVFRLLLLCVYTVIYGLQPTSSAWSPPSSSVSAL